MQDYGPHTFVMQIRDLKTHEPLPGIDVGDIGPKFGYNSVDNGYMRFNYVRLRECRPSSSCPTHMRSRGKIGQVAAYLQH